MKLPKNFDKEQEESGIVALLRRFLFRHGEKIAAGILVVAAVWCALNIRNYSSLSWQPNELEELATETEEIIRANEILITDADVRPFHYADYAEQIRTHLPIEPYRFDAGWRPVIHPGPPPRSGFDVLTAEALRGEAVRRDGSSAPEQWRRPSVSGTPSGQSAANHASIWVNVYGTIPLEAQWEIYNLVFESGHEINRPRYVYYELEKAEIDPQKELTWQPVIVFPDLSNEEFRAGRHVDSYPDFFRDRLIPFEQRQGASQESFGRSSLLFSDFDVEPARTYVYRIRLYLANPNYNLQESSVKPGVDTRNEFVRSHWSSFARVYVPDRTLVQIFTVTPTDSADFPRQAAPLGTVRGAFFLDYFDIELGQSLPLVERRNVERGMICNMSKSEANRILNRGKTGDDIVNINYPDAGLRSDVCVMDLIGGRRLQKRPSREAQGSPDLTVTGKALLLMPDGTMQITSTAQELFY